MAVKKGQGSPLKIFISLIIVIILVAFGYYSRNDNKLDINIPANVTSDGFLTVHFIDVGQGDSELIVAPTGEIMLIDAGTGASEKDLLRYLDEYKITDIDYAVFTHPHEDHIGGADGVVEKYNIKNVIMPDVIHTTKTFENLIKSIDKKNINLIMAHSADSYKLGDAEFTILAPNSEKYESLNDYSIVLKLTYGKNSFMFTGDAEAISENEITSVFSPADLKCDVLKIGHHGSTTSSTEGFLSAVNPKTAVISCGMDNDYGHPHRETLDKLSKMNVSVYRTDLLGSIVIQSSGSEIKVIA